MKKIISLCVSCIMIMMMFSVVAFAADSSITLTANKTEAKPGDVIELTVKFDTNPGIANYVNYTTFNKDIFSRVNVEYYDDDLEEDVSVAFDSSWGDVTVNDAIEGKTYMSWAGTGNKTTKKIGQINYKVADNAVNGTYDITFACEEARNVDDQVVEFNPATIQITITGGAEPTPEEEEFEIKDTASALVGGEKMMIKDEVTGELKKVDATASATDKVVAIFSKDIKDNTPLAAKSYGIIFGGKRYPGVMDVPDGASWAVKLVGPADKLPAGNYTYGIFAAGQTDLNAGTYEVK